VKKGDDFEILYIRIQGHKQIVDKTPKWHFPILLISQERQENGGVALEFLLDSNR
jgi:hypothetical protein